MTTKFNSTVVPSHSALSILCDGDLCINMQMGEGDTAWKRATAYVSLFNSKDKKVLHLWNEKVDENPITTYITMQLKGKVWFNSLWNRYAAWKEAGNNKGAVQFLKDTASAMKSVLYSGTGISDNPDDHSELVPVCPVCGRKLVCSCYRMFNCENDHVVDSNGTPYVMGTTGHNVYHELLAKYDQVKSIGAEDKEFIFCPDHIFTDAIMYTYRELLSFGTMKEKPAIIEVTGLYDI